MVCVALNKSAWRKKEGTRIENDLFKLSTNQLNFHPRPQEGQKGLDSCRMVGTFTQKHHDRSAHKFVNQIDIITGCTEFLLF
jgi:hypothetical protein